MADTFEFTRVAKLPSKSVSLTVTSPEGTRFQQIEETIAASTTDQEVAITFTTAGLKAVYIYADGALTLETNATDATGGNTISVQANVPLEWVSGGYYTSLFTQNVTKFYMTNGGSSAVNYYIYVLSDGTP